MDPAAFIASIFAPAVLYPPEIIRRSGYAAVPALNQATGGGVRVRNTCTPSLMPTLNRPDWDDDFRN
jgi:hypothetical protein